MAKKKPIAIAAKAPLTRGLDVLGYLDATLGGEWRETFARVVFGVFIGGLALLLILLYAGVPIVGS
jgi:hypothetical protein